MIRNIKHIMGVVMVLAIPFFIGWMSPNIADRPSLCPVMVFWHIPCPGCGITKSVIFLYRGNIPLSIHYHPFGIILVIILIILLILSVIDTIKHTHLFDKFINLTRAWQLLVFIVICLYIRKMALLLTMHPDLFDFLL